MEDFSRFLCITRTLTFMCCVFSVFSLSDVNIISQELGSTVTLHCNNRSLDKLNQLMWKRNGVRLFTYRPDEEKVDHNLEVRLKVNMSTLESQLYALIIENAQDSHTGNYTCEMSTRSGFWEQKWMLIITEKASNFQIPLTALAAVIPTVCILIFIITCNNVCKRRAANVIRPPTAGKEETIYENCLEIAANQQRHLAGAHSQS
ncbi:uncharacterized protein LOC114426194 [Parambassis ranga]|uniref:Uncharacterized protein LOC114426194 n=1 Tax=Parambassis ranga TaxID=210632 RepID=A0A6P7HL04_9TELE|nr:uncharacterized protein LOC114426194 [Parambassis ranga]